MKWMPIGAALLLLAPPATAQIEPGRVYAGGERVSDPESGLSLTVPPGWRGRLSPDGETFRMESEDGGYMVVLAHETTEGDARRQMAAAIDVGDGIVLTPAGEVRQVATRHLSGTYTVRGTPAEMVGTVDVRITQTGLGVVFILLSPPDAAETQREALREFALSLGVEAPKVQAAGGNDAWQPYLRGMYLARFFTRTGYTESTELWLCSNGVFYYNSGGGGFGGGASGAAQATGGGRWSATGAGKTGTLILQWGNGERSNLRLEYDFEKDRLYVNGDRMLRGNNERCT